MRVITDIWKNCYRLLTEGVRSGRRFLGCSNLLENLTKAVK
jgi:hypothetical protein